MLQVIENQGFYYLIHIRSGKTFRSRFVTEKQALICLHKLSLSWLRSDGLEQKELETNAFLKGDEVCVTLDAYGKRVA